MMPIDGERGAAAWWKRSSPAKRLSVLSVPLVAAVAGVTAFHLADARKRGEPLWPVLLGLGVTALILSAVVWFVRRPIAGLPLAESMRARAGRSPDGPRRSPSPSRLSARSFRPSSRRSRPSTVLVRRSSRPPPAPAARLSTRYATLSDGMVSSAGSALSLIKAVLGLVADRRTGVLDVRSDGLRTQIYFDYGRPLYAEDEAPGETFGRLLMRQGVITNDQFVRVIDEMTRAAAGNSQLRFGEVAVALGVLTPEQVERGLAEQVCGIIARSLQRGDSQWAFEPSATAAKPPRSFSLEINPVVLAAMREAPDTSAVAEVVAARPEDFVVVAGPRPVAEGRKFGKREVREVREGREGREEGRTAGTAAHAARMAAEQAFQKGMALLRETKTASAAIELRRASELQPESLEYLLYATWAKARSYREIPSESEQRTLLEIAQRAKRRDPMFAFGSYVIGQVAMWAGDDATAKKWFYEALRIDPTSEAGKQVRILARRGAGAPIPPDGEGPADLARTSEQAPVSVSEPPVQATASPRPSKTPSRAPSGRGGGRLLTGAALLATGALVILAVARRTAPSAGPAPGASPHPAISVDAALPVDSGDRDSSVPDGPANKPSEAMREKDADDGEWGTVLLPSRASGHRIFVDGRRFKTDGIEPLHLRCGPHVVQIGSSGTPDPIDLPCGGEVQLQ